MPSANLKSQSAVIPLHTFCILSALMHTCMLSCVWLFGTPWIVAPCRIFQARILEWVVISSSRVSFWPYRNRNCIYNQTYPFLKKKKHQLGSLVAQSCCFVDDPADVGNLISGSSAFSKTSLNIRKFTVHILLKPGLENFKHHFY